MRILNTDVLKLVNVTTTAIGVRVRVASKTDTLHHKGVSVLEKQLDIPTK